MLINNKSVVWNKFSEIQKTSEKMLTNPSALILILYENFIYLLFYSKFNSEKE